jgi:NADH-quinone oxidoreductase subunit N
MDDYRGLAGKRPWLAGIFTAMLFSLAGIPLTAGFIGKFYVVAAGAGSSLWLVVIALVINSVIGLFYYLRIVVAMFTGTADERAATQRTSRSGGFVLAVLTILLVWLGVYPGPLLDIIKEAVFF